MAPRKPREPQVLESFYPLLALVFLLVACTELCDAATVVDVYRLIHYDISGVPFGSRAASLNHHAASLHFPPAADLSRTVFIIPLCELNFTFVKGTPCFSFSYFSTPFMHFVVILNHYTFLVACGDFRNCVLTVGGLNYFRRYSFRLTSFVVGKFRSRPPGFND